MISYRDRPNERIILWWERGVPRVLGRHSLQDRARMAALGQHVSQLALDGDLECDIDPHVLWAITRSYSSVLGYAQIPRDRLTEVAWGHYVDTYSDEDWELPEELIREVWTPTEVAQSIKRLCDAGLLAFERITPETRLKGQGHANRYSITLPAPAIEAESHTT